MQDPIKDRLKYTNFITFKLSTYITVPFYTDIATTNYSCRNCFTAKISVNPEQISCWHFLLAVWVKGQDTYDLGGPILLKDILTNNLYNFLEF